MITIHGTADLGSEYQAAKRLAELAGDSVPRIADDHKIHLDIFPNAQCFGQSPQDIDLLVFFADYRDSPEVLQSFCATIEVKEHDADDVRFIGSSCIVSYNGKDHDATKQSEGQKYSVVNYCREGSRGSSPYVTNLIWLRRIPSQIFPKQKNNLVGADLSWPDLLEKVRLLGSGAPVFSSKRYYDDTIATFGREIKPSKIDRARLEAITRASIERSNQQYISKLGKQLLIFRGRGGTGKTVRLLQLAYHAYTEYGSRVILLTYNRALVADLNRLLALLKIKNSIGGKGVAVRTIHGFIYDWLKAFGLLEGNQSFIDDYERLKRDLLEFLASGAISSDDVTSAKREQSTELLWDLLLIDESQDWPESERDLIYALYDFRNVVLADGVDQFVRSTEGIDWRQPVDRTQTQVVPLRKSLRLKASLCQTVSNIAERIQYNGWNLHPLPESYGGRVLVVFGGMQSPSFHQDLLDAARSDGNEPIDVLYCVPPSWVDQRADGTRFSKIKEWFDGWGYEVWDAVDENSRDKYPTSLEQVRVVQYESCRGLEGWVVVNCGLDEFYDYKKKSFSIAKESAGDLFFDEDEAAEDYARRWLMIPLTRAIDTLVVHLNREDSDLGRAFAQLADEYPENIDLVTFD